MTRVALYARVSTYDQVTENQMMRLITVARERGYEIVGKYEDYASGADAKRPELDKMVAAAKQHKVDKVMATKLDRIGRSVVNVANLMADFDRYKVVVEFIDQPIDTSTSAGNFMLDILSAAAEYERELIRDRTLDGLARANKAGKYGGRPKRKLTQYQRDRILEVLKENPEISNRKLASNFNGISTNTLIKLAREEGLIK